MRKGSVNPLSPKSDQHQISPHNINTSSSLLRSLYFLPIEARLDFYFKVILPSMTYGLLIWGSCGKTLFSSLERLHVRAARIIHRLMDKYTDARGLL